MTKAVKSNQGFTLIEVLIAMTLLSVIVVLLFASLKICAQSWEQGESKITDVNDVAVVYNFFQQHLISAKPVWNDFSDKDGLKIFAFQGTPQTLQFVTTFPASVGRKGLQQFTLFLKEKEGEKSIQVELTPFFPLAEGEQWNQEQVALVKHVKRFELSYFGSDTGADDSAWQTEWLEKENQPRLVKISIELENGIFWPDMILELKVAGNYSNEDFDSETPDDALENDDSQSIGGN
ncbi:MAG: prepilin-type N-terminal cleavage/methylation domain-containing protein [Methylococcales bacterium]|nr:prepilin-type N-terminal cleavage/methylation domain-containing protein [Methylococcaceae bacterium]